MNFLSKYLKYRSLNHQYAIELKALHDKTSQAFSICSDMLEIQKSVKVISCDTNEETQKAYRDFFAHDTEKLQPHKIWSKEKPVITWENGKVKIVIFYMEYALIDGHSDDEYNAAYSNYQKQKQIEESSEQTMLIALRNARINKKIPHRED